jgi:phosphonate transport system substrate-binding protein
MLNNSWRDAVNIASIFLNPPKGHKLFFFISFSFLSIFFTHSAWSQSISNQINSKFNQNPPENDPKNPKVLTVAFASIEDNSLYDEIFSHFMTDLKQCMNMPVLLYPIYQETQVLKALKEGKLHLASLGTGATMFAVNQKAALPFVSRGSKVTQKNEQYELWLITKNNTNFKKITDLKGKKIAHTTVTSNSGNLAPRALFPKLGLAPDVNYTVEFSGRHDKSILGVKNGFYDAAAIASDVFNRMVVNQQIKANDFKVLWKSQPFPTNSFVYNLQLNPQILKKIKTCFAKYEFPQNKANLLNDNTVFLPVSYDKDWRVVREVYEKNNP